MQEHKFVVTTDVGKIPRNRQVIMIDGTVPCWVRGPGDHHWDHHKPGCEAIQIDEIPLNQITCGEIRIRNDAVFVTTQLDADAVVAAASIVLAAQGHRDSFTVNLQKLRAIAWDCDHLALPPESHWDSLREFAAKAVAALKQEGFENLKNKDLLGDQTNWPQEKKNRYQHTLNANFCDSVLWVVEACNGNYSWPGEQGEADAYFRKMEEQRPAVGACCHVSNNIAVFDQSGFSEYVDPRLLAQWVIQNCPTALATVTIRDGKAKANQPKGWADRVWAYTVGWTPGTSPMFSTQGLWEHLTALENQSRESHGIPPMTSGWGGREDVGGSSWNDAVITDPHTLVAQIRGFLRKT